MTILDRARRLPETSLMVAATALLALLGAAIALAGDRIAIAAPALLLGLLAATISPPGAIGACMLATPFVFDLEQLPRGSFSLLELGILVTVAGYGLHLLLFSRMSLVNRLQRLIEHIEVVVPAIGIVIAAATAMIHLADPAYRTESLREVRLVIIEPILLLGIMLVVFCDRRVRAWAVICLIGAGTALSGWALLQVMTGSGVVAATDVERATASYPHPNNLALFLDRSLLVSLPLALIRPRVVWPWLLVGAQLGGLMLTFSRGSLLAVAAGVVVMLAILGYRRQILWVIGGTVALVAILLLVARDRVLDPGGDGHEPTRLALWRSSVRMLRDHPIWGVGPDQFLYAYWRRYVEPIGWAERYTSHPHNLVLDIWLRLGVIGIASFATLALGLLSMLRQIWKQGQDDWLVRGSLVALAGAVVHGMVDNSFFLADLATLTWLFVAIIATTYATTIRRNAVADEA